MTIHSFAGVVAGTYAAVSASARGHAFVTRGTGTLALDLAGIPGDLHSGPTRKSGAREPWFARGTVIRNDRQVSALCRDELAVVAQRLGIAELKPEWIGGNLLIAGLADFSRIAPGSRLAFGGVWGGKGRFDGGAVLRVEAYNKPCRQAGRALAAMTGTPEHEFAFVKEAAVLRGLMLSVDVPGAILAGDAVVVLAPIGPG